MDEEFKEWIEPYIGIWQMTQREVGWLNAAWLEAARRAKRAAWKECAETLESNQSCSPVYIAVLIRKELAKPEE